ncbi:hypothetical protein ABMA09_18735 [Erwinia rhapontici]|uniref:hypothetical protein n=1 Tax=Erwinia rhapontici TaxID=55212 RepID=UPI003D3661F7
MLQKRLKAPTVALLIVLNAIYYSEEKQKAVTRYKMVRKSFKLIARRKALHATFIADVTQELQELGWQLIEDGDGNFCFFDLDMTVNWARLSIKRVRSLRDTDDDELMALLEKHFSSDDSDDVED